MSTMELLVVLFGLFLGYWVVSRLIGGESRPSRPSVGSAPPAAQSTTDSAAAPSAGTWHAVLGVSPDAPYDQIIAARNTLLARCRTDSMAPPGDDLREQARRRIEEIERAFDQAMREPRKP